MDRPAKYAQRLLQFQNPIKAVRPTRLHHPFPLLMNSNSTEVSLVPDEPHNVHPNVHPSGRRSRSPRTSDASSFADAGELDRLGAELAEVGKRASPKRP